MGIQQISKQDMHGIFQSYFQISKGMETSHNLFWSVVLLHQYDL